MTNEEKQIRVPGHCRFCGCTESQPCDLGGGQRCWWVDQLHTLCSASACLGRVPIDQLKLEVVPEEVEL